MQRPMPGTRIEAASASAVRRAGQLIRSGGKSSEGGSGVDNYVTQPLDFEAEAAVETYRQLADGGGSSGGSSSGRKGGGGDGSAGSKAGVAGVFLQNSQRQHLGHHQAQQQQPLHQADVAQHSDAASAVKRAARDGDGGSKASRDADHSQLPLQSAAAAAVQQSQVLPVQQQQAQQHSQKLAQQQEAARQQAQQQQQDAIATSSNTAADAEVRAVLLCRCCTLF